MKEEEAILTQIINKPYQQSRQLPTDTWEHHFSEDLGPSNQKSFEHHKKIQIIYI